MKFRPNKSFLNALVLVLFALWVVGFVCLSWTASNHSPANQHANRGSHTEKKTNAPTPQNSATVETPPNPTNDQSAKREKTAFEVFFELKLTDVLLVIFTALLAWKTSGLFTETAGLRDAADKQRLDTLRSIEAAEKAAKATERAADTTAASVDLTKRQLRAYVTVNGIITAKDPGALDAKEGFAVLIDIKNSGQTPALDSLQWARIEIREFPLTTLLPIHCLENSPKGILPPEAKSLMFPTFTRDLTIIEKNAILKNHTAIYVYGEVDYLDIFGERHLTQFRFRCNGQGFPLGMFKPDGEGNEAT